MTGVPTTSLERLASHYDPKLPDTAMITIPEGNGDLRWLKEAIRAGALAQETRYRQALEEIRDHWANQYDHPRKESEMYRGPYGIGVTDGHRACTIIAERALALPSTDRSAALPKPANDGVRKALEALSMWCTSERRKIRGRGGFDNQTEREIGIGIVESEIDRRAALQTRET